jgi:hypothetical protein
MKDSKEATEANIALPEEVFAFLVDNRDVAVEFCAHLLMNMDNQGAERGPSNLRTKEHCVLRDVRC